MPVTVKSRVLKDILEKCMGLPPCSKAPAGICRQALACYAFPGRQFCPETDDSLKFKLGSNAGRNARHGVARTTFILLVGSVADIAFQSKLGVFQVKCVLSPDVDCRCVI